jgi:hypothetical protein
MIKIYNDAYYAFQDLINEKQEMTEEVRDRILKYVFTSSNHCVSFLEMGLYRDAEEREKAFQKVLTNHESSAKLVTGDYKNNLSTIEIDNLVESALEHWQGAVRVYFAGFLNEEQKKRAFDIITLNQYTTMDFLKHGQASLEQRMFLLNETNLVDVPDFIIRYYKLKVGETNDTRPDRKQAMDMQFKYSYRIYEYAKKGLLTKEERALAYENWGKKWYDDYKYQFDAYYEYCKIFQEFLNDHELKLFYGKFTKNGRNVHKLRQACTDFYVPSIKIKVESLAVAFTLKKAATRR